MENGAVFIATRYDLTYQNEFLELYARRELNDESDITNDISILEARKFRWTELEFDIL